MPSVSPAPPAASVHRQRGNQAFLTDAARLMSFDVYCAALRRMVPAGGTFTRPNGGQVLITYKKTGGGQLEICEGQCPSEGQADRLVRRSSGASLLRRVNAIYASVASGRQQPYSITATGIAQSELASIGSTMIKVRKPDRGRRLCGPRTGGRAGMIRAGVQAPFPRDNPNQRTKTRMDRKLLSGDEAVALAALHAGVVLGTGYPGTPSTEILEASPSSADTPSGRPTRRSRSRWGSGPHSVAHGRSSR